MQPEYYTLPLRLDKILKQEESSKCSVAQSVAQHIHLIITTAFGEMQYDEALGCSIWGSDFDNLTSSNRIKEFIKQSLLHSVAKYEPRLQQIRIEVRSMQEELYLSTKGRHIKKKMDITVSGLLTNTRDSFVYNDQFYTGPLSYSGPLSYY